MTDQNIYVSNGTCYTAAGKELDKSFIPCGNDAFGHQTCCGAGDNCLADKSCFGVHGTGYGSKLTYMAGCTDPDYHDASCPDKKNIDQPWIALTLCDNSDGVWAACSQEGNPSTLQPGSFCTCTDAASATVAFSDSTSLSNFASLPKSIGGTISFADGHVPTGRPTGGSSGSDPGVTQTKPDTSTGGGMNTGKTSGTVTQTSVTTAPPGGTQAGNSNSSGLNSGAKIGIGVGIAIGILVLVMIGVLLFLRHRRRNTVPDNSTPVSEVVPPALGRTSDVSAATTNTAGKAEKRPVSKADKEGIPELDSTVILEADGHTARPWAMGSELEATQVAPERAELPLSPVPELAGSLLRGESRSKADTEWRMR